MTDFPHNFGEFILLGELGSGSTGVVYQARDLALNRPVAVKLLRSRHASEETALRRFLTEAEAVATLEHPHIVPVYKVGAHEGRPFLCMKLFRGGSLAERISGTPWPTADAARLVAKLANAVAHAHERGVLHRDLKPGNVLLDESMEPFLADFGLAKLRDSASELTASQAILGTPAYMAPEVAARGQKAATTAADIYSLGAVLYEMLTGRPPFVGDSALSVLDQVKGGEFPVPRQLNPAIPHDLELICLKCLQREVAGRYAAASEISDDCERFLRGEPVLARESSMPERLYLWIRRHKLATALTMALGLSLLLGLVATLWQWTRAEEQLVATRAANQQLAHNLARSHQALAEPMLDSDQPNTGLHILARLLLLNPSNQIARTRLESELLQQRTAWPLLPPLRHTSAVVRARFDLTNHLVLTATEDDQVHLWDSHTGEELRSLPHRCTVGPLLISSGGDYLATSPSEHVVRFWSLADGRQAGSWTNNSEYITALACSFSRPELALANRAGHIQIRGIPSGEVRLDTEIIAHARMLRFDWTGRMLFVSGPNFSALWRLNSSNAVPLPLAVDATVTSVDFSRAGSRLLTVSGGRVQVWNTATGQRVRQIAASAPIRSASFNTDGKWIATGNEANRARAYQVDVPDDTGRGMPHNAPVNTALFAPRDRLVVTASDDGSARLWHPPGGNMAAHPIWHRAPVLDACVSSDYQRMLTVCADSTVRVWSVPRAAEPTRWWEAGEEIQSVAVNRNGDWLAVAGVHRLRVFSRLSGEQPLLDCALPMPARHLEFSPTDRWLATGSAEGRIGLIAIQQGEPARIELLSPKVNYPAVALRFSTDGKLLALATARDLLIWTNLVSNSFPAASLSHCGAGEFFIAPTRRRLAVIETLDSVRLYDGATFLPASPPLKHPGTVATVCISPDGKLLASGDKSFSLRLWQTEDGTPCSPWLAVASPVTALAFSPDSRNLLVTTQDGSVRLWDAAAGRETRVALTHNATVDAAVFSPDGRQIATSERGLGTRLWDAATGLKLTSLHKTPMFSHASFSADGRRLWIESFWPGLDSWMLPGRASPSSELLIAMTELLTGDRVTVDGTRVELSNVEIAARLQQFQRAFGPSGPSSPFEEFRVGKPVGGSRSPNRIPHQRFKDD